MGESSSIVKTKAMSMLQEARIFKFIKKQKETYFCVSFPNKTDSPRIDVQNLYLE